MILRAALIFVIGIVTVFVACSGGPPESKSRFLSTYSAQDLVEKSYDRPPSDVGIRVAGGSTSSVLDNRRIYHVDDTADLRIRPGDERSFLERIKAQIELQLQVAGCTATDAASGESNYSIAYTDGVVHGWINIGGMRRSDDDYRVVITITEH